MSAEVPIEAVLLDAGGVLLLPDPAAFRRAFSPYGIEPDDETCRRAHYASMREVDRLRGPDWPAVDRVLARATGVPEEHLEDVLPLIEDAYLRQPWVAAEGAVEALLALQAAGFHLGVVSNASGTMEQQLADHQICSVDGGRAARVAVVIDSEVVGVEKPDPRIFRLALDAIGVDGGRCVYVGDTVHFDVEGSRAAGIHPLHLDPYRFCPDDDHDHVESLRGVLEWLDQHGTAR